LGQGASEIGGDFSRILIVSRQQMDMQLLGVSRDIGKAVQVPKDAEPPHRQRRPQRAGAFDRDEHRARQGRTAIRVVDRVDIAPSRSAEPVPEARLSEAVA